MDLYPLKVEYCPFCAFSNNIRFISEKSLLAVLDICSFSFSQLCIFL